MKLKSFEETHPVAAKAHTCDWCSEVINKGERHTVWAGIRDREFYRNRLHNECVPVCRESCRESGSDEFTPRHPENKRPTKA